MIRQGRLHVPHATYYVVNRFRPGLDVLVPAAPRLLDADHLRRIATNRRQFEKLLAYVCTRWCARVHAYCWLPDSAHLLIQVCHVPLEYVLHSLRGPYSRFLREHRGFRLPVYAGRYQALLIDPDEFFLDFARHIFWSPANAGLCATPLAYEYSSACTCMGEPAAPFLHTRALTDALAARGFGSRASFIQFLASNPSPNFAGQLPRGSRFDHRIAGDLLFVREMQRLSRIEQSPVPLETVLLWVSGRLSVAVGDVVGRSRYHLFVLARALVAWLATCMGRALLPAISRRLCCSPSTLHRAIRHYARLRPQLFSYETLLEFERYLVEARETEDE